MNPPPNGGEPHSTIKNNQANRIRKLLSSNYTYIFLGAGILVLDLSTGPFLQFPILFLVPVILSAWFSSSRMAYWLAFLLPVGRFAITELETVSPPLVINLINAFIRVAVLGLIAYLVSRTSRQTRELQSRVETLVTICAWSRTVEFRGKWISFEEYLLQRFNINTTHGISPEEAQKAIDQLNRHNKPRSAASSSAGLPMENPGRSIRNGLSGTDSEKAKGANWPGSGAHPA